MDSVKNGSPPLAGTARQTAAVATSPRSDAEVQSRHQAFLAYVRAKEQAWANLSPTARKAAEAGWEAVIKNINDARAGHRKVFVD